MTRRCSSCRLILTRYVSEDHRCFQCGYHRAHTLQPCGKICKSSSSLDRHQARRRHVNCCDWCDKQPRSNAALQNHIQDTHFCACEETGCEELFETRDEESEHARLTGHTYHFVPSEQSQPNSPDSGISTDVSSASPGSEELDQASLSSPSSSSEADFADFDDSPSRLASSPVDEVIGEQIDTKECCICGNRIDAGYELQLPCKHLHHATCILQWFIDYEHLTCPMCREVVPWVRRWLFG